MSVIHLSAGTTREGWLSLQLVESARLSGLDGGQDMREALSPH